jgi:hypothetical protein
MRRTAFRSSASLAACVTLSVMASGCSAEGPDASDVMDRFASMERIPGDPDGDTDISTDSAGVIWAMVRRDDVTDVDHAECSIDGAALDPASEDLNVPEPSDLGASGQSQTMFAFASARVAPGEHTLTCSLDAEALLVLVEPQA